MTRIALVVPLLSIASALPAAAQAPDTVLVNGKIVTVDAKSSPCGKRSRSATGGSRPRQRRRTMRKLAGPATRIIDLGAAP